MIDITDDDLAIAIIILTVCASLRVNVHFLNVFMQDDATDPQPEAFTQTNLTIIRKKKVVSSGHNI